MSLDLPEQDKEIRASRDPELIARGRHIVSGPGHCAYCHGDPERESDLRAGREIPLSGGRTFDAGPLGAIVAPNLTSDPVTGIGGISDAMLVRSLRYGVSTSGRPLAPFMPFANLTDRDLKAVISYLRTLPPVRSSDENRLNVLGKAVMKLVLAPQTPSQPPRARIEPAPTPAYGRYLAHTVASCRGCHTKRSKLTGAFVGAEFAGGMRLEENGRTFVVPDITPAGRVGALTQREFIELFRARARRPSDSPMPWRAFGRMSDTELKAIFAYLRTLPTSEADTQIAETTLR